MLLDTHPLQKTWQEHTVVKSSPWRLIRSLSPAEPSEIHRSGRNKSASGPKISFERFMLRGLIPKIDFSGKKCLSSWIPPGGT
jgi:hypothetical protein